MSEQHTPGPWTVMDGVQDGGGIGIGPELDGWGGPHALVTFTGGESEANARLIAAAPDMLEALRAAERLTDYIRQHKGFLNEGDVDKWAGEVSPTLAAAIATATEEASSC